MNQLRAITIVVAGGNGSNLTVINFHDGVMTVHGNNEVAAEALAYLAEALKKDKPESEAKP